MCSCDIMRCSSNSHIHSFSFCPVPQKPLDVGSAASVDFFPLLNKAVPLLNPENRDNTPQNEPIPKSIQLKSFAFQRTYLQLLWLTGIPSSGLLCSRVAIKWMTWTQDLLLGSMGWSHDYEASNCKALEVKVLAEGMAHTSPESSGVIDTRSQHVQYLEQCVIWKLQTVYF